MRVNIEKITNALNKVTALTSEFKGANTIPGVLLDLSENLLKINFTDSHKAVTEEIEVITEENDFFGPIVVDYSLFLRAISNCQPSGSIKVKEIEFKYDNGSNTLVISADMLAETADKSGEGVEYRKLSNKHMDIKWNSPDADMKTKILTRVNYNSIFEPGEADVVDTYNKKELIKDLKIASVEKGKQVYISSKTQSVFVSNQAHATTIPVSKLNDAGELRIHSSLVMTQPIAKSIIDILNKSKAEDVKVYSRDKACNIFIDEDGEKVGIWFEMPPASKVHVSAVDKYNSLGYNNYHTAFLREFFKDIVKSASASLTKDGRVELAFVQSADPVASPFDLVINGGSAAKSTKDMYTINAEYVAGDFEALMNEKFIISLDLLITMLNAIETELVAVDFEVAPDGSKFIRIAEIDMEELDKAYADARKETKRLCEESGDEFIETATPTPLEVKMQYMRREGVLKTKQYTTLLK